MIRYLHASLVAAALGLAATPVHADVSDQRSERPMLFLGAGAGSSIRDLDEAGSKLGTGFSAGAGLGFPLNDRFTLRATYAFNRAEGENLSRQPVRDNEFNRHYYGADLQFRPTRNDSAFRPYVSAGVGLVTVDPADDAVLVSPTGLRFERESFTKPAGRLGLGFEYRLPRGFGLHVEGTGWVYDWDMYGLNRTQFDTNWTAGLTYRF